MKALLMKDCYVLWKQIRLFVIILLAFCLFNGSFGSLFVVIWSAMMPYTAMAYDERSKWDQLAAMMPYSVRDIVLSKYALGWLCMGCALVVCLAAQGLAHLISPELLELAPLSSYLLGLLAGVLILNITLPLFFRFGVERGRLTMFLLIILICGATGALTTVPVSVAEGTLSPAFQNTILAALALLDVVTAAVSVPLSMRLYRARH